MLSNSRLDFKSPTPVLRARSVAIVGASERAKWPSMIFSNLRQVGYQGKIYPINPKYSELWGVKCFPNFAALPEPADHAAVIVPASAVLPVLNEGIANGLRAATIYASSFGEGANSESIKRGAILGELCKQGAITIAGPNCMGSNSIREKYLLHGSAELNDIEAGSVAFVTQSGGTLQFLCRSAAQRGVRFSYMISSGNEIDLDLADYINFLVDEEHTKVILLFIEGIRRPEVFMKAAARALAAGKPILAVKTGKSDEARSSAISHTGAIAGDYDGYLAMCERYGIINCRSLDDLLETCLCFQQGRLTRGSRVAFVTTSGGTVDLLHDYTAEISNITVSQFSDDTKEKLQKLVLPEVILKNPLDLGSPPDSGDKVSAEICKIVLADPQVDILAWAGTLPLNNRPRKAEHLPTVVSSTDKPVIGFGRMYYMFGREGLEYQDCVGFPFLQGLEQTVRALSSLVFYSMRSGRQVPPLPAPNGRASALQSEELEAELSKHALTPPLSEFVSTAEETGVTASRLGFPVALKLVSPEVSHKTEVGGVRLNLRSAEEVVSAAKNLQASVLKLMPDIHIDGFLVQEMVEGYEVLIGVKTDPQYGPIMVVGSGGILAELLGDVALRLLPVGAEDARAMLGELKISKILAGFRGKSAADVDALVKAICGLSDFYLEHRHILAEFEINPLMVLPQGKGVRAVDVRAAPNSVG
jgi:acetyltransferase